jgi:hypothetical protein
MPWRCGCLYLIVRADCMLRMAGSIGISFCFMKWWWVQLRTSNQFIILHLNSHSYLKSSTKGVWVRSTMYLHADTPHTHTETLKAGTLAIACFTEKDLLSWPRMQIFFETHSHPSQNYASGSDINAECCLIISSRLCSSIKWISCTQKQNERREVMITREWCWDWVALRSSCLSFDFHSALGLLIRESSKNVRLHDW